MKSKTRKSRKSKGSQDTRFLEIAGEITQVLCQIIDEYVTVYQGVYHA